VNYSTGRLLNHDPESRNYAAPRRTLAPRSWMHTMGPVTDQGFYNGCVGWSVLDWLNSARGMAGRRRWNRSRGITNVNKLRQYIPNEAGLELYGLVTRYDDFDWTYPPTDNGSSGLGAGRALKQLGIIDSYLWTFEYEQMLAHGQQQPVLVGTYWTDAMSDPDRNGIIHIGSEAQLQAAIDSGMGHEYVLRGVNWPRKLARIRNHWTADWGLNGDAYIPLEELRRLVIDYQGDVMVPSITMAG